MRIDTRESLRKINLHKKERWIYFYAYSFEGKIVYIGHTGDFKKRRDKHRLGNTTFGREFLKDHQCEFIDLKAKVWDVPLGRWATAIERGFIDLHETAYPKGQNKLERERTEQDRLFCRKARLGLMHSKEYKEEQSKRMKLWWAERKIQHV